MEKYFGVKLIYIWKKVIGGGGVNFNIYLFCLMCINSKRKLKILVFERGGYGLIFGFV